MGKREREVKSGRDVASDVGFLLDMKYMLMQYLRMTYIYTIDYSRSRCFHLWNIKMLTSSLKETHN